MKLIEEAEPNVRLALKFFRGLGKGADEEVIRSLREMLGRLRTFEQHRLQYGSERDQQTLLRNGPETTSRFHTDWGTAR